MAKLALSLTLTFLTPLVFGKCSLVPVSDPIVGTVTNDTSICLPQGPGFYTFGMSSTLSPGFPLAPGGGGMNENGGTSFLVMDNSCTVLGVFPQPGCGIPFYLEANYLDYVLVVTHMDLEIGGGYFYFGYANGEYSIGNNGCGCNDKAADLTGSHSCKCASPVAGQPTRRSIASEG